MNLRIVSKDSNDVYPNTAVGTPVNFTQFGSLFTPVQITQYFNGPFLQIAGQSFIAPLHVNQPAKGVIASLMTY